MKKARIEVTYVWEVTKKEWDECLAHWADLEEDMKIRVGYDPIHTFFMLRDIGEPSATVKVKEVN